ncbi:hypothetical protein ACE38W_14845 [Chitinophaga sp. Hz27]|uniref:hypothetical protein n=1 Tax=Chitinophaga sp. Hz27 TaxID=3347169 RepID=UPI0035D99D2D
MEKLSSNQMKVISEYTLKSTPDFVFKDAIREFSVQRIYDYSKRRLMKEFPNLMPSELHYSIIMAEVFSQYKCDDIACCNLLRDIEKLKGILRQYKKTNTVRWIEKVNDYNRMVKAYSEKVKPLSRLITKYKMIPKRD